MECLYVVGDIGLEPVALAFICKGRRCFLLLTAGLITQIGFFNNYSEEFRCFRSVYMWWEMVWLDTGNPRHYL